MYSQMNLFGNPDLIQTPQEILKSRGINSDAPIIVSYGGGKNSTALLILCKLLGIKIDLILFADTGGEMPETYDYIKIFSAWLIENKMPEIVTVSRTITRPTPNRKPYQQAKKNLLRFISNKELLPWLIWWCNITFSRFATLEEHALITNTLPSAAYRRKSCSRQFKIEPQNDYVAQWKPAIASWGKGIKPVKLIGYHAGEIYRLIDKESGKLRLEDDDYEYHYPLINYDLTDVNCVALIKSAGLAAPPKSSCFFCPNRRISEVRELKDKHPELYARGLLIERTAKNGVHWRESFVQGLGSKFAWSEIDNYSELETAGFDFRKDSRSCTCID